MANYFGLSNRRYGFDSRRDRQLNKGDCMEFDIDWSQKPDAKLWTQVWLETIKKHPSVPTDPDSMFGWFANAIMCGWDSGYKAAKAQLDGDQHE